MACNFTAWFACLTARYQPPPPKTHSHPPQSAFYLAANATGCPHTNTTQNLCAWHVILPRGLRVSPLGTSPPPPKTHSNPPQSAFYLAANATGCPHTNTTQNLCAWHVILPRGLRVSPLGTSPPPPQDPLQSTAIRVLSGRKCDRVSPHKHHPKFVRMACNFTAWFACLTARYQPPPQDPLPSTAIRVLSGRKCDRVSPHKHHPKFVRMACNFTAWFACLTARYQPPPPKTHSNPPQSAFYLAANATGCPHTNTTQNLCAWHVILPRGLRVSPLGTSPPPKTHSNPPQSAFYLAANATGCPRTNTTQNLCA
jgi:hypothetical protein